MIDKIEPRYIGDGVYVRFDGYHVWLLTGSHDRPDNAVALEPQVYEALTKFAEKAWGKSE